MGIELDELDAILGDAGNVSAHLDTGTEKVVQPGDAVEDLPGVVGELLNARIGAEILEAAVDDEVGAGGSGAGGNAEGEGEGCLAIIGLFISFLRLRGISASWTGRMLRLQAICRNSPNGLFIWVNPSQSRSVVPSLCRRMRAERRLPMANSQCSGTRTVPMHLMSDGATAMKPGRSRVLWGATNRQTALRRRATPIQAGEQHGEGFGLPVLPSIR